MEFSFEINTIATVGAEVARKAAKRKRNATVKNPEPVKQQKFDNGEPFTANSPPRCSRERVALNEEASSQAETSTLPEKPKTSEQEASRHVTMSQAERELLNTVASQVPSEEQKPNESFLLRTSSTPETSTSQEETKIFEEQAPEHDSPSLAKRKRLITIEDLKPHKQRILNEGSAISTSSQHNTSNKKQANKT